MAIRRTWAYRLLLSAVVLLPVLALAGLTTLTAVLNFGQDFETNWFYYSCGLVVAFLAGMIAIVSRAGGRAARDGPSSPRAAAVWGGGRLSLAFLTVLALTTMTLWNMDLTTQSAATAPGAPANTGGVDR